MQSPLLFIEYLFIPFPPPLSYSSPPSIPHKHNSNVLIINSLNCITVNVCRCKVYRLVIYIYAFQFEYILLYYRFCLFLSFSYSLCLWFIHFLDVIYLSSLHSIPLKWTIRLYTIAQYHKQSCSEVLTCLLVIVSEEISAILSKKWNFVDIGTSYT